MAISTPMLVTFCVYIFGMILIGFIARRSTKTLMTIFLAVAAGAVCYGFISRRVGYERLAVNGAARRYLSVGDL